MLLLRLSTGLAALLAAAACDPGVDIDPAWADAPLPSPGDPVDDEVADAGAWLFRRNCAACHHIGDSSMLGPDLAGVTRRRSAPWIAAMIRNPDSMLVADSIAQRLLAEYQVPMANRRLDGARVRALLEFLHRADAGEGGGALQPAATADTSGVTPSGLAWRRSGRGPLVVLVHGTNLDRAVWSRLRPALARSRTVVEYDLRTHGGSSDTLGPWSEVGDLDDVLSAAGVASDDPITLVGLSAGAGIALEFALTRSSRVERLVLVSPSVRGFAPRPGEVPDVFGGVRDALEGGDSTAIGDAMVALPTFEVGDADRPDVDAMVRRNLRLFAIDPTWAIPAVPAPLERLGEVAAPAIVVVGTLDFPATRRLADELVAGLPSARAQVVDGGRHLLPITDHAAVLEAILGSE